MCDNRIALCCDGKPTHGKDFNERYFYSMSDKLELLVRCTLSAEKVVGIHSANEEKFQLEMEIWTLSVDETKCREEQCVRRPAV